MMQKRTIYATLEYMIAFLLCTVCLYGIACFLMMLDQENPEFTDCFLLKGGQIVREVFFDGIKVDCGYGEVCACLPNGSYLTAFYLLAFPVFLVYGFVRDRIVCHKYSWLFILSEICIWGVLCYWTLNHDFYKYFAWHSVSKFMMPMAILMFTLQLIPPKILKVVSIIIGIIYAVLIASVLVMILPNFC